MIKIDFLKEKLSCINYSRIIYKDVVDSTNNFAISNNLPEKTIVIAGMQTAGKGRSGRKWVSESNNNLYLSVVLPKLQIKDLLPLNIVAGYAVCDTIRKYNECNIKWPNDIVKNHKKAGGLLIETKFSGNEITSSVLGIGLNLFEQNYPKEIKDIATYFFEDTNLCDVNELIVNLMLIFDNYINELKNNSIDMVKMWPHYSAYLNKEISIHINNQKKTYIEKGINKNGGLIVKDISGKLTEIYTGDIGYDFCS
jgi:BirA family biotin operon repressor/biotin-[acetyl-CoA-carboxylase] ligase